MVTMREMAAEYRVAAAKIKMKIEELSTAGAPARQIADLRMILTDIREAQRLLDSYYDIPRTETFAAVGWKARRSKDDKH